MLEKLNILVVDDEKSICDVFHRALLQKGYNVGIAKDGEEALACLEKQKYQIVLLDIKMPKLNGLEVLKSIKSNYPQIEVIMISGHGTMRMAQESIQLGAYDYLTKPIDIQDLYDVIERTSKYTKLTYGNEPLYAGIPHRDEIPVITGVSHSIKLVLSLVQKIAPTSSNVLILGETGTGKELVAHHIHKNSQRKDNNFIVINCAALPDTLLESELFGYESGAFTDASKLKRGLLEVTNGGTLFLDEIAELSPALQAKILRVVETGKFRRLGSNKEIQVNIRIISATNKDLTKEIGAHRFREDLFYRLGVVSINMPPLRERKDDIPLLVDDFLRVLSAHGKKKKEISNEAMEKLKEYNWPGNIRELRNVVERMLTLTDKDIIEASDLANLIPQVSVNTQRKSSVEEGKYLTLSEEEEGYINKILEKTKGNISKAAKILGITRHTLYHKIKRYRIKK